MHRLVAFLALLLLSLPVVADQLSTCLEETRGVTAAINSCLDAELSRQDARLNAAYETALGGVAGDNESRLRNAQRQWIKYRDASCDFIGSLTGGTVDSIRYLECLIRETSHRANELALPL